MKATIVTAVLATKTTKTMNQALCLQARAPTPSSETMIYHRHRLLWNLSSRAPLGLPRTRARTRGSVHHPWFPIPNTQSLDSDPMQASKPNDANRVNKTHPGILPTPTPMSEMRWIPLRPLSLRPISQRHVMMNLMNFYHILGQPQPTIRLKGQPAGRRCAQRPSIRSGSRTNLQAGHGDIIVTYILVRASRFTTSMYFNNEPLLRQRKITIIKSDSLTTITVSSGKVFLPSNTRPLPELARATPDAGEQHHRPYCHPPRRSCR
jgi:hypothetical protein